ncbi:MAG TPA: CSLREA domain-containing protein [Thermoleophilaceae bacterium]
MTRRRLARASLAVVLATAALPAAASAAPIAVNTTTDALGPDSQCTLREALSAANDGNTGPGGDCAPGSGGADVITLPASVNHYRVILGAGGGEDANGDGDLDNTGEVTIRGAGASKSILDAEGTDRVIDNRPGGTLTLEDLTVSGGVAPSGDPGMDGPDQTGNAGMASNGDQGLDGERGGGIRSSGPLTLTRVTVRGNSAGDGGAGGDGDQGGTGAAGLVGGASGGGSGGVGGDGGGIFAGAGSVTITSSLITQNSAGTGGDGGNGGPAGNGGDSAGMGGNGGLSIGGAGGFPGNGGGISVVDTISLLKITDSRIVSNDAGGGGNPGSGGDGGNGGGTGTGGGNGGISNGGNANFAGSGGGINLFNSSLELTRTSITDNDAGDAVPGGPGGTGGDGGLVPGSGDGASGDSLGGAGGNGGSAGGLLHFTGSVTINDSLIARNRAGAGGTGGAGTTGGTGAIAGLDGDSFGGHGGFGGSPGGATVDDAHGTLENVTIANNVARQGGAGGAGGTGPNESTGGDGGNGGSGAGAIVGSAGGPNSVRLVNTTIAGNSVGAGGAAGDPGTGVGTSGNSGLVGAVGGLLRTVETVIVSNTIVASNVGTAQCGGPFDGASANDLSFPNDGSCPGTLHGSPLLSALANHGGPTETMTLAAGSPAINAGDDSDCGNHDQRGVGRPKGPHCDIGAVERSAPVAATGAATAVTATTATLNGSLVSSDLAPTHRFDVGKTTAYGAQTAAVIGSGNIPAKLFGLEPNTTYHYRLRVSNFDGAALGADRTFTTAAAPLAAPHIGLSVRTRSARLDRKGRVKIKVRCNKSSTERCKGTLSLAVKVKRKTVRLGRRKFNIAPGKTGTVRVKISKRGRRLIKRKRKLRVRASAKAKNAKTAKRKITLRPARRTR